jgi:peroxiredoxin
VIEAGAPAPDFTLLDHDGQAVSLSDLRGEQVLLVFYPADFSPVCTDQLSVYQADLPEFERRGVRVLGISVDSAFCHRAFRSHLEVSIPLAPTACGRTSTARPAARWCWWGRTGRSSGPTSRPPWSTRTPI